MAEREQIRQQRAYTEHEEEAVEQSIAVSHSDTGFNVDNILDDIDGILETNATSFVQGFVQKGGE